MRLASLYSLRILVTLWEVAPTENAMGERVPGLSFRGSGFRV